MRIKTRSVSRFVRQGVVVTAIGALLTSLVHAESPADLAPDKAGVFVQIDDAAGLRKAYENDPLVKYLQKMLPNEGKPGDWVALEKMLGLTSEQIVDRFFGKSAAFVAERPEDGGPWMLMSRVTEAEHKLAVEKLGLQFINEVNGYKAYRTSDDSARMAFGKEWMVIAEKRHERIIGDVLKQADGFAPLSKDKQFAAQIAKLPADRVAFALLRDSSKGELHSFALTRNGLDAALHYAGQSPQATPLFDLMGDAKATDFGPLPASTLAAVTLNLDKIKLEDTAAIDRLLTPRKFETDIAPKLAAPVLLFAGQVDPAEMERKPDMPLPALGVAIRLRDRSVAIDLDRVLDSVVTIANVGTIQWQTAPIALRHVTYQQGDDAVAYRVADFGTMLAQRTQRPELAPIRVTYGRIGDWYVITTQHAFFKACLKTQTDPTTALANSPAFRELGLQNAQRPIGAAFVRTEPVADMMTAWLNHWREHRPQLIASSDDLPQSPEARFARGVSILATILKHHKSVTLQAHRDDDGQVRAVAAFKRKPVAQP